MRKDIQKLRKKMKHTLDKERYQHTLGVMYLASSLAMCHKEDVDKALTAGVLHDCAKCIPAGERIARCEAYGLPVTDVERKNPSLLHAKLGAKMAQEIYGVQDPDILNAIASHTTGRPGMSLRKRSSMWRITLSPDGRNSPTSRPFAIWLSMIWTGVSTACCRTIWIT